MPSRRAVAAGLAWALPVVAVGTAAPAYAVSACPTLAYALDDSHTSYDEISIRNTGTRSLPLGTTITWVVQNRSAVNATLTFSALSGVSASVSSVGIASGGTATITFTLTAALAPGATLYWRYAITNWNYATRVTINGCVGATTCLSSVNFTPGTACPGAPVAAARAASGDQVFPDPLTISPKR